MAEGAQTCFFEAPARSPDFTLRFLAIMDDIEPGSGLICVGGVVKEVELRAGSCGCLLRTDQVN